METITLAVYPGSFDPITNGHIDIIKRAANVFDYVIIAISNNLSKSPMFDKDTRLSMVEKVLDDLDLDNVGVEVNHFLLTEYIKRTKKDIEKSMKKGIRANNQAESFNIKTVIVKGLRSVTDFEYELQMALANKALGVETVFFTASTENMYISSGMVKQIDHFGGDVSLYVPNCVERTLHDWHLRGEKVCKRRR